MMINMNCNILIIHLSYSKWTHTDLITLTLLGSLSLQFLPVQFNVGEHGFDNEEMDMKPIFRAVGPAFQKNLEVGPFETVNIYPLMCHVLGIKPDPNDGHLDATKHMLVSAKEGKFISG